MKEDHKLARRGLKCVRQMSTTQAKTEGHASVRAHQVARVVAVTSVGKILLGDVGAEGEEQLGKVLVAKLF